MADKTDGELFEELFHSDTSTPPATPVSPAPDSAPEPATAVEPPAQAEALDTPIQTEVGSDPDEWLAALPDEVRSRIAQERQQAAELQAQLAQERQQRAAIQGRLTPMQRRVAELERLQQAPPEPVTPAVPIASTDSYFDSDEWKVFQRDYPDEARTQRALLTQELTARDRQIAQLAARQQDQEAKQARYDEALERLRLSEAKAQLSAEHPDWMDINARAEFHDWLTDYRYAQPEEVRGVFLDDARFQKMLTEPVFVSRLLTHYKRETAAPLPAAAPAAPTPKRKLELAAAPDTRGQAPMRRTSLDNLSDGELFEYLMTQK